MKLSTTMFGLTVLAGTATAETITGTIYCDNYFEFYFNGEVSKREERTMASLNLTFTYYLLYFSSSRPTP